MPKSSTDLPQKKWIYRINCLFTGKDKKSQIALSEERDLYLDLANAIPSGMYRIRVFPEGIKTDKWHSIKEAPYRVEFVNNHFCEILSIDKQDFEMNPGIINNFLLEDDKEDFAKKNVEANIKRTPFKWQGRFVVKSEILWVSFESIPRALPNGDVIWTGTLHDITEKKREEQLLELKTLELSKVNTEKDKFLAIVAHDLKAPFNGILGFSKILTESIQSNNHENSLKYSEIIRNCSQKAMDLLLNLTVWSQAQSGRMVFNPEKLRIDTLINDIIPLYSDIATQKSIHLHFESHSLAPTFFDKAMVSTILRNLISNAIKFTTQGGSITIKAEQKHDGTKEISVHDTGVGMTAKTIAQLFCIDGNCSTPDTQNEKGTGLGLLLCMEFVQKHNGKIWVESKIGIGSTFYFTIPN